MNSVSDTGLRGRAADNGLKGYVGITYSAALLGMIWVKEHNQSTKQSISQRCRTTFWLSDWLDCRWQTLMMSLSKERPTIELRLRGGHTTEQQKLIRIIVVMIQRFVRILVSVRVLRSSVQFCSTSLHWALAEMPLKPLIATLTFNPMSRSSAVKSGWHCCSGDAIKALRPNRTTALRRPQSGLWSLHQLLFATNRNEISGKSSDLTISAITSTNWLAFTSNVYAIISNVR